jgi:hypothetical protein
MKLATLLITFFASVAIANDPAEDHCMACSKAYMLCGMVSQALSY